MLQKNETYLKIGRENFVKILVRKQHENGLRDAQALLEVEQISCTVSLTVLIVCLTLCHL